MTTNPSSSGGRRHRGRRGRRSGNRNANQQQAQQQHVAPEQTQQEAAPAAGMVEADVAASPEQARPPRGLRQDAALDARPRGDRGGRGQGRRRQPPRQPVGPMPSDVLKRHVRVGEAEYPLQMRPVAGLVDDQGSNFGCPMLQRNMTALPATGNQHAPRCSLGWSLHNEHEAHYCMHTPELLQCWKAHPEHIPVLDERIETERNATQAAD